MRKRLCFLLIVSSIATLLLVACSSTGSDPGVSGNQVHMGDTNFAQSVITIKKGERLTLVADTFISHTIANGTWKNGASEPAKESGAPVIDNVAVGGNGSEAVGPFTNAGAFKFYCTVHSGMNLTVIVR